MTQIEVESTFAYKAYVLRSLLSGERMSKGRLRHVRHVQDELSTDNMIIVDDPILVTMIRCELQITMIRGMSKAGKKE